MSACETTVCIVHVWEICFMVWGAYYPMYSVYWSFWKWSHVYSFKYGQFTHAWKLKSILSKRYRQQVPLHIYVVFCFVTITAVKHYIQETLVLRKQWSVLYTQFSFRHGSIDTENVGNFGLHCCAVWSSPWSEWRWSSKLHLPYLDYIQPPNQLVSVWGGCRWHCYLPSCSWRIWS